MQSFYGVPIGVFTVAFPLDSNQAASISHVANAVIANAAPIIIPTGNAKGQEIVYFHFKKLCYAMHMHTTMLNIQYVTHGIQLHARYSYRHVRLTTFATSASSLHCRCIQNLNSFPLLITYCHFRAKCYQTTLTGVCFADLGCKYLLFIFMFILFSYMVFTQSSKSGIYQNMGFNATL